MERSRAVPNEMVLSVRVRSVDLIDPDLDLAGAGQHREQADEQRRHQK